MNAIALAVAAFGLVAGSMAIWFGRMSKVQIPKDRRGFVACWLGGALLGLVAISQGPGLIAGVLAGLAVLAGTFFSVLVLISPQKVAADVIRVGEKLRDFTATDEHGDTFSISSYAGKPVLLKFFRGHW